MQTSDSLHTLVHLIFEKALVQSMYSALYADLCKHLCHVLPQVPGEDGQTVTFQKVLLKRCQSEFEGRTVSQAAHTAEEEHEGDEQHSWKKRTQRLGIIKFVG